MGLGGGAGHGGSKLGLERRYFLLTLLAVAGCGRKRGVTLPPPVSAVVGAREYGLASWYGHPYHGRRTSNGEIYDMRLMTAAHLRLPFGTWLRVTNRRNKKWVDVRVNDRGPFVKNRIIDLSQAAAEEIEMIGAGVERVVVEVIAKPGPGPPGEVRDRERGRPASETAEAGEGRAAAEREASGQRGEAGSEQVSEPPAAPIAEGGCEPGPYYGVQVGAFGVRENAERARLKMSERYGAAVIVVRRPADGPLYRVVLGPAAGFDDARSLFERLRREDVSGFVTLISEMDARDCL